jgi:Domain of unknown function (DUF5916)
MLSHQEAFKRLDALVVCAMALGIAVPAAAQEAPPAPPSLNAHRLANPIRLDGVLDDEGWREAERVETWFETNPGDNTPPPVGNVGFVGYDDRFFYAGFEFQDPDPRRIRAPFGDRDSTGGATDYGGVILDTRNDGRTGILFLANAHGIQYDAVTDDVTGNEDSSPDFYWDAAARITETGWSLEIRIPFASLRYPRTDPQTWGVMLYRNYPRAFRYQFFSTRLPRGGNCFICRSNKLSGFERLPRGGGIVIAPYASASRSSSPAGDVLGAPLEDEPLDGEIGLDVKWRPGASTAVDATVNPDFSQIESDVALISANERFALFYPEKRPFFLEGIELFSTPVQALYTRTITAPRWGLRGTGKVGRLGFTALVAEDEGGGQVILPGPEGSELADQDFGSYVGAMRLRHDFGRSFVSVLGTAREVKGGGHNRVLGPDLQWRPTDRDNITGQVLWSRSQTPDRPDLADEWDGRSLSGHAADLWWSRSTSIYDWFVEGKDVSEGFRADTGFVPQVGYRQGYAEGGYTFHPEGAVRRLRLYLIGDVSTDRDGELLNRQLSPGFGLDGKWNTFARIRWAAERVRNEGVTLPRQRLIYTILTSPSRLLNQLSVEGDVGEGIDFTQNRRGRGANIVFSATLRPTNHLELRLNDGRRWLNVDDGTGTGERARLFTARVDRLRATYTFTPRFFVRAIAQWVETVSDPSLYVDEVAPRTGELTASALVAYKLNWQTVAFVGYGDGRELDEGEVLQRSDRQFFVKISYALQR